MNNVISFDRREGDLAEYFALTDTPAANSPVGRLMVKVLAKFPGYTLEQARVKANELQTEAAGKRNYVAPAVLTDEEQETRRKAVRARFKRPELAA